MPSPATPRPLAARDLSRRLAVLRRLAAAGQLPTDDLDHLTLAAQAITGAAIAMVTLIDEHHQVVISHVGLNAADVAVGIPLHETVCQHVMATGEPLTSSDLRRDDRLEYPAGARASGVVAYAGTPLYAGGALVGSVCLMDVAPRQWSPQDFSVLGALAASTGAELALHLALADQGHTLQELRYTNDFLQMITQTMPGGLLVVNGERRVSYMNAEGLALLGWDHADVGRGTLAELAPADEQRSGDASGQRGAPIARALENGRSARVPDDAFLRRDGSWLPVSYSVAPTTLPDGSTGVIVVFDDNTVRHEEEERLRGESETLHEIARIKEALAEERLVIYAQPIVELASGKTVQHELLIRMLDRDGSVVPPMQFLPIAEEYGLIKEIDRYVIERAMRFAAAGQAVELNISAHSLSDDQLGAFVEERLAHHGVDPSLLVFEITETALVANEATAGEFARVLSSLGCAVALDDFGTGYGSFHYLKHIPAQVLKIDREFVRDVHTSEASQLVIKAVIGLAKGMGMETVAEGIEDEATLETMRSLGVDHAQGYYLGRPAPAVELFSTARAD